MTVVVDSFYGKAWVWFAPHVFQKGNEIVTPFFANFNTPSSVVFEISTTSASAPTNHTFPTSVFWAFSFFERSFPVGWLSSRSFFLKAPTTFGVIAHEFVFVNYFFFSTVTAAKKCLKYVSVFSDDWINLFQNEKTVESLADYGRDFGKPWHDLPHRVIARVVRVLHTFWQPAHLPH